MRKEEGIVDNKPSEKSINKPKLAKYIVSDKYFFFKSHLNNFLMASLPIDTMLPRDGLLAIAFLQAIESL